MRRFVGSLLVLASLCLVCAAEDIETPVGSPAVLQTKLAGEVLWVHLDGAPRDLPAIDRKYLKDANVQIVTPQRAGVYRVQAIGCDAGKPAYEIFRIVAGTPPIPAPPGPPPPDPTPRPSPVVESKLWIVIIEETGDAVISKAVIMRDPAINARIAEKKHAWRIVDKDVVDSKGKQPADIKAYLDAAKGKRLPQLFLVGTDGVRWSGDLPSTPAEVLQLIIKAETEKQVTQ